MWEKEVYIHLVKDELINFYLKTSIFICLILRYLDFFYICILDNHNTYNMKTIIKIGIIIIFILLAMFMSWDDARRDKLNDEDIEKYDSINPDCKYIIIRG